MCRRPGERSAYSAIVGEVPGDILHDWLNVFKLSVGSRYSLHFVIGPSSLLQLQGGCQQLRSQSSHLLTTAPSVEQYASTGPTLKFSGSFPFNSNPDFASNARQSICFTPFLISFLVPSAFDFAWMKASWPALSLVPGTRPVSSMTNSYWIVTCSATKTTSSYKQFFLLTSSFDNTAPDTEYNLLFFFLWILTFCPQKS